jgi:hypothetical protein
MIPFHANSGVPAKVAEPGPPRDIEDTYGLAKPQCRSLIIRVLLGILFVAFPASFLERVVMIIPGKHASAVNQRVMPKRRTESLRPAFSPPNRNTPAVPAASRHAQEARIMGVFRGFQGAC